MSMTSIQGIFLRGFLVEELALEAMKMVIKERKGLKRQKEAKTIKNRQGTKETRARSEKSAKDQAGSARHSRKESQEPK
ncbi:hypothetical protein Tco_1032996 [Tanacetum coccineum]|uniref:Uncharacterized protein n=1 Tax=Tanacetum coccineum TaxID=301880 RepID=A0ABQ5GES2_9ASTR